MNWNSTFMSTDRTQIATPLYYDIKLPQLAEGKKSIASNKTVKQGGIAGQKVRKDT